jgi:GT2 family glycosyltransferase
VNQCDVVIVNFNTGEVLKDAVASVLRSQSVAHVYVVDNASADSSLDFLPRDQGDRLTVIRNQANLGYAAACNIGLSRATSDNVLLFNPDAEAAEGAIERLITVLGSGERIGMVGPLLLNSDGSEQAGGRRKFPMPQIVLAHALGTTWLGRRLPGLARPPHLHALPDKPTEVESISGACMMVRRAAVAAVGPLDERYFLHCEDLDWCLRFHQQGWAVLFVPDARVVHRKGVSSKEQPLLVEYYKHKGMAQFYRKFLGETYPNWQISLLIAGVWARFSGVAVRQMLRRVPEWI